MRAYLGWLISLSVAAGVAIAAISSTPAMSGDSAFVLTFKDNKLVPAEIEVPAGQEFTLIVKNADGTPEEFESQALDIEKIIPGGSQAEFKLGPLDAGGYDVVGEFHEDTARGKIIVK